MPLGCGSRRGWGKDMGEGDKGRRPGVGFIFCVMLNKIGELTWRAGKEGWHIKKKIRQHEDRGLMLEA